MKELQLRIQSILNLLLSILVSGMCNTFLGVFCMFFCCCFKCVFALVSGTIEPRFDFSDLPPAILLSLYFYHLCKQWCNLPSCAIYFSTSLIIAWYTGNKYLLQLYIDGVGLKKSLFRLCLAGVRLFRQIGSSTLDVSWDIILTPLATLSQTQHSLIDSGVQC